MKYPMFRKTVQWLGLLLLAHLVSAIFFGVFLSSTVAQMAEDAPRYVISVILWYDVIFSALFFAYVARGDMQYADFRKTMREEIKAGRFSLWQYFGVKEYLIKLGAAAGLQIPFVIFFAIVGMPLQYTPLFAEFYIMDAGCYLLTNSAILGWVLNTVLFGAVYGAVKLLMLNIAKTKIKKDLA